MKLLKNYLFQGTVICIAITCWQCQPEKQIQSPIPGVNLQAETKVINAKTGGSFKTDKGTQIIIHENSFVDMNNQPVQGDVNIEFREFHDAAEAILSGIPMTYDSGGVSNTFQTAGMFEINGYKDGKPVFIKGDKRIEVSLTTDIQESGYNFYVFNDENKNWEYLHSLEVKHDEETQNKLNQLNKGTEAIEIPEKIKKSEQVLDIQVDYSDFPELKRFQRVLWKFDSECQIEDVSLGSISGGFWEDAQLTLYNDTKRQYRLTLLNAETSINIIVEPALSDADYQKAITDFENEMEKYDVQLAKRLEQEKEIIREGRFVRSMQIANFGTYNCDRIFRFRNLMTVRPIFAFNESPNKVQLYYITGDSRTYFKISPTTGQFSFSLSERNFLVALLPQNKVAIFRPDQFRRIPSEIDETSEIPLYTFNFESIEESIKNAEDFTDLINNL